MPPIKRVEPVCPDCGQKFSSAGYSGGAKFWTCACVHPAVADGVSNDFDLMEWEKNHPGWRNQ